MSTRPRRLGLLGGTFDPIHCGHLDAADAARRALALDEVWLLPSHLPPHRTGEPVASPFQRFAMAVLATADRPGYQVSDLELTRTGRTYTIDTLRVLHTRGWTPSQIFFILGTDAFAEIATWHEYPEVLDAAHFVIIARPGTTIETALARTSELRPRVSHPSEVPETGTTRLVLVPAQTRDVSSTLIREQLRSVDSIVDLVPAAVNRHILTHHLYTR